MSALSISLSDLVYKWTCSLPPPPPPPPPRDLYKWSPSGSWTLSTCLDNKLFTPRFQELTINSSFIPWFDLELPLPHNHTASFSPTAPRTWTLAPSSLEQILSHGWPPSFSPCGRGRQRPRPSSRGSSTRSRRRRRRRRRCRGESAHTPFSRQTWTRCSLVSTRAVSWPRPPCSPVGNALYNVYVLNLKGPSGQIENSLLGNRCSKGV